MKSNVSDCLELMACIYRDATIRCSTEVSDLRDLDTLRSRTEKEGMSFLTITLPNYCKAFEKALAVGFVDPKDFSGFRMEKSRAIPAFLQGMLGRIFSRETGRLLNENPQETATLVESVRQICLTFKKVQLPCTPAREKAALENFKQVERNLHSFSVTTEARREFCQVSDILWHGMLYDFHHEDLVPRHGPGATSERVAGNRKYVWGNWPERLEPFFPIVGSAYPMGVVESPEEIERVNVQSREQELPVRVVFVPKTLKAPRVIAIEPCAMQYAQQAVRSFLYRKLGQWPLTSGKINFSDQTINQALALEASVTGQLATIDLTDASDRVPLDLVCDMLSCNPDFRDCVMACRSSSATLPDGTSVPNLAKFASMGSALCFPIEAMYFYTVVVVSLLRAQNLPISVGNIYQVTRQVYVYGDDIVVPVANVEKVLEGLQEYNCKPNPAKTFFTGKFRESCGVDAYDGYSVTPTYIRHMLPCDPRQASEIASLVSTRNLFYKRGFWATASFIQKWVDDLVGPLPYLEDDSDGLGYTSFLGSRSVGRWNRDLPRFEVRTFGVKTLRRTDELNGYPALAKSLLKLETLVSGEDSSPFDVTVLRGAVTLKRRWVRS
jgi:hypothetical protein